MCSPRTQFNLIIRSIVQHAYSYFLRQTSDNARPPVMVNELTVDDANAIRSITVTSPRKHEQTINNCVCIVFRISAASYRTFLRTFCSFPLHRAAECGNWCDVVSVSTSRSRDAPTTRIGHASTKNDNVSVSAIFTSRFQYVHWQECGFVTSCFLRQGVKLMHGALEVDSVL